MWSPLGRCIRRNNLCTRTRTRECDNPPPSGGGTICIGKKIDSVTCNANDCGRNSYDSYFIQIVNLLQLKILLKSSLTSYVYIH